jgi:hypothetical protein
MHFSNSAWFLAPTPEGPARFVATGDGVNGQIALRSMSASGWENLRLLLRVWVDRSRSRGWIHGRTAVFHAWHPLRAAGLPARDCRCQLPGQVRHRQTPAAAQGRGMSLNGLSEGAPCVPAVPCGLLTPGSEGVRVCGLCADKGSSTQGCFPILKPVPARWPQAPARYGAHRRSAPSTRTRAARAHPPECPRDRAGCAPAASRS